MIPAHRIVLDSGQTYEFARIYTYQEIDSAGIPRLFDDDTFAFTSDRGLIVMNQFNLNIITISLEKMTVRDGIPYEQLIISGDVVQGPGTIIRPETYGFYGIPELIGNHHLRQFTFTDMEGVHICSSYDVASVINPALTGPRETIRVMSNHSPKPANRPLKRFFGVRKARTS